MRDRPRHGHAGFVLLISATSFAQEPILGAEDDANLDNVNVNIDIFKAYTRRLYGESQIIPDSDGNQTAPYGGRLLTYMQTVRFLTDYINGDTYYSTRSEAQPDPHEGSVQIAAKPDEAHPRRDGCIHERMAVRTV